MRELKGKVAVVTGAASGIGRALAERFAGEGMAVALADVDEAELATVERELTGRGARAIAVRTDVSSLADIEGLAARTLDAFKGVHVLCNNAGVGAGGMMWEQTLADWQWTLGVNLWGVIYGIRTFVPLMLSQGGECHIVNTASVAGLVSTPGMASYNVSKHGVVTLSETLQHDLAMVGAQIKVSVLCPGFVATRIADAERNRPDQLRNIDVPPQPEREALQEMLRALVAEGMAPSRVAEIVVEAVRADRFYILPHPEMKEIVRRRMEEILEERTPTYHSFMELPVATK
jgi:NAD(P)-dependent dehydrogenase (short-subunit alcohol dehydrogenase family)